MTNTDDSTVEAACMAAFEAYNMRPEDGESALETVVEYIVDQLDEGHWEDLLEENDGDPDEVRSSLAAVVHDVVLSDDYKAPVLTLYRAIRVTCPPDEVRVTGTAEDIGFSWSRAASIESPDFLSQYGEDGGRDVFMSAEVRHKEIDWLETFFKRCNPWIRDYEEVVLLPHARPRILSINDPAVTAEPEARNASPVR